MKALIETEVRSVTFDCEMKGAALIKALDFLFPKEEWRQYTIKIKVGCEQEWYHSLVARVKVDPRKHRGLHAWNEGYRINKTTSGSIQTQTPAKGRAVSTNVLATARTNPRLVYSSYVVEVPND